MTSRLVSVEILLLFGMIVVGVVKSEAFHESGFYATVSHVLVIPHSVHGDCV